ncbi:MAG: hypothetical protein M3O30_09980 [Planctomycetota bacterium]|nr:hypothetical protein [Planctomycetota bacterium]
MVVCSGLAGRGQADTVTAKLGKPVTADLVGITYGTKSGHGYAGVIPWSNATYSPSNSPYASSIGTSFYSFCVDLGHNIFVGSSYTYTILNTGSNSGNLDSLGGISLLSGSAQTGAVNSLGKLYSIYYNSWVSGSANSLLPTYSANDTAAAFQIAIWDIIYGMNGYTVSSGTPKTLGSTMVSSLTQSKYNSVTPTTLLGLQGVKINGKDSAQDQALLPLFAGSPPGGPSTPLPNAFVSGVVLLGTLCGVNLWKIQADKRKQV